MPHSGQPLSCLFIIHFNKSFLFSISSSPHSHYRNQTISPPFWKTSTVNYHFLKLGCSKFVGLLACVMMDFTVLEPVANLDVITAVRHTYYGRLHTYFSASFGLCFNVGWEVLIREILFWCIPKYSKFFILILYTFWHFYWKSQKMAARKNILNVAFVLLEIHNTSNSNMWCLSLFSSVLFKDAVNY